MNTLRIYVNEKNDLKQIKLIGKLNIKNYRLVERQIDEYIINGCNLSFDLTECDYISSSGFRVLMIISKKLKKANSKGIIIGISNMAKDIINSTGFNNIFRTLEIIKV